MTKRISQSYEVLRNNIQKCPAKRIFIISAANCILSINSVCELVSNYSDEILQDPDYNALRGLHPHLKHPQISLSNVEPFETIIECLSKCNEQICSALVKLVEGETNEEKLSAINIISSSVSFFSQYSLLSTTMTTSVKLMNEIIDMNNKLTTTFNLIRQNLYNSFVSNKPIKDKENVKLLKDQLDQINKCVKKAAAHAVEDQPKTPEDKEIFESIERIQAAVRNCEARLFNHTRKVSSPDKEFETQFISITNALLRLQMTNICTLKEKGISMSAHIVFADEIAQIIPDIQTRVTSTEKKTEDIIASLKYIIGSINGYLESCDKETKKELEVILKKSKEFLLSVENYMLPTKKLIEKQSKQDHKKEELKERLDLESRVIKTRISIRKTVETLSKI
jgi:hypothetical protein